ncbi:MAG: hypothetical protein ABEI52_02170, partial [Halobacteriaceae archaeon]
MRVNYILVLILVFGTVSGAFGPASFTEPAKAAQADVRLDKALSNQQKTVSLTFTLTATRNGTIDVTADPISGDSNVDFTFDSWTDLTGAGSGISSSWSAQSGHEYRITYTATVSSGASGKTDGAVRGTVSISGPTSKSFEELVVNIDYLEPKFGIISDRSIQVVFEGSPIRARELSITVPNRGNGVMVPSTFDLQGVPGGIRVTGSNLPNRIPPGESASVSVEMSIDEGINKGTYEFTGIITDNLGNRERVNIKLRIIKPPKVNSPKTVNLGDVLVGTKTRKTFTISEGFEYVGIQGLQVDIDQQPENAILSFPGIASFSTPPGGSNQVTVQVSV